MKKKVVVLKVDLYTRIVLTIIALCLSGMLLKPFLTVQTAEAELKEAKIIQDVNIAMINGRPPEIALPLRVNVVRSKMLGVKIEDSAILPVSIEKPETFSVSIEKSETLPVNITKPDMVPVRVVSSDVIDTRVIDSVTMPVEIVSPFPVPVVQTVRRMRPPAAGE